MSKLIQILDDSLRDSISARQALMADEALRGRLLQAGELMVEAFRRGKKVLFCGNGGSAADAQHLSAELSGRFYFDREPLPAEALHVNTSFLTAVANDYDFATTYARMLRGLGQKGDVLVALSTSGRSPNVVHAAEAARKIGISVVGMTGASGGPLADHSDILLNVPSEDTPRIQELHMLIGHVLCQYVEASLFRPKAG